MRLSPVDYNDKQHVGYQAGRALTTESHAKWRAFFDAWGPAERPLDCLDLGSGTGRFTPMLAELFGGRAFGVEPSDKMRALAEATPHPAAVSYLPGRAEQIPAPDASCGLVVMFLSFHHVGDRAAAAREVVRVLAPGGRLIVRSTFADRMPDLDWHRYFPRAREIELAMFPTTREVIDVFAPVGLRPLALETVRETYAASMTENAARLRTRAISTFEHLSEAEIEDGFKRLDAALADDPGRPIRGDSDVMVFAREP